jgi:hypothetical protein
VKREFSVFREQFSGNSKSKIQHLKFFAKRMLGQEHAFEVACRRVEKKFSVCRDSGD